MTDAIDALREIGHIADASELTAFIELCFFGIKLADRQVISETRGLILKMLTQSSSQTVPALDASMLPGRRLASVAAAVVHAA